MSTLKADKLTAATTNGNLLVENQGTGGIAIDGMPHRNLIINGDLRISQRGTSFATLTASTYVMDRWRWLDIGTTAGAVTITQDTDAPTVAEAGTDFARSIKIDCTTAEDLGSAGAFLGLSYVVEAQDAVHLGYGATGALATTFSFWIKSTKTGVFCTQFAHADGTLESWTAEHTIATTNTWQRFSTTITGDSTGSAINDDNGAGLNLYFILSVGSDNDDSTAGTWQTGQERKSTANQVNLLDSTSNNVFITGVQWEVGAQSSDFEHIDIASQKAMCKRYYDKVTGNGSDWVVGFVRSTTTGSYIYQYAVEMRSAPTIAFQSVTDCDVRHAATSTVCSGLGASGKTTKHCSIDATVGSGLTVGHGSYLRWNDADGYVTFDSEL